MLEMFVPRRRCKTDFVSFRDTIHNGVAFLEADDVPYDVPIDFFDDVAFFMSHNDFSYLLPDRDAQDETIFFDLRYSNGYSYKPSNDVPFDVPIHILEKIGDFNVGYAPA